MRKAHICLLSAVCLFAFSAALLAAPPAKPVPVQTRLKRVALFKNGLGFFVREGTLQGDSEVALLGPFASASHGTFWVSCPARAGLRSVTAREVLGAEEVRARDIAELLRANVGGRVTIWAGADPESATTGELIGFAPDRVPEQPDPYAMGQRYDPNERTRYGAGRFVLLKTDDGVLALDPQRVWSVQFAAPDIEQSFTREVEQVALEASLTDPRRGDWLSVSYLAKGITWAPSYLIDISDGKEARLSAKAVVINEAEDLEAAHVDLITGFPNLQFADIASPVSMRDDLDSFLRSLVGGASRRAEHSVITQNVMVAGRYAGEAGRERVPGYGAAAAGQIAEDLFLYPVEDVALAKGETGYYPLFTETVPYTEFYHWEIPDYVNEQDRYGQRQREERDKLEEVWHSLRLTNTTAVPWTTAPAQLMKDGQITGQDTLNYTPPKGEATVKITQAISVKAEQTEVEVKREREALRMYGNVFDRVTIQGTLSVTNFKGERVSLEIAKTLSGDVKSATPKAEDVTLARGLARMNPTHLLTWELDLEPAEHEEIGYTYEVLIRR